MFRIMLMMVIAAISMCFPSLYAADSSRSDGSTKESITERLMKS